jgi:hypothetical protein
MESFPLGLHQQRWKAGGGAAGSSSGGKRAASKRRRVKRMKYGYRLYS